MLGQSAQENDIELDPAKITAGVGIPHGELLVRLVEASFETENGAALAAARAECDETLGHDVTVDAAAVIANFHMMSRLADSMGSPLDDEDVDASNDLRSHLGVESFNGNSVDRPAD